MKINIITNIIPTYRDILFKELANISKKLTVKIYICAAKEPNRNWEINKKTNYDYEILNSSRIIIGKKKNPKRIIYFGFNLFFKLLNDKPEILVIGDAGFNTYISIIYAKLFSIKHYIWLEDSRKISEIPFHIFLIKRILYQLGNTFIVPSYSGKELLKSFGIKNHKIKIIKNAVNNDEFNNLYKIHKTKKLEIRKKLGLNNNTFCFLLVAQLINRKRILETIDLLKITAKKKDLCLIIVGSGYLENQILEKLKDNIIFYKIFSNLNNTQLSKLYTAADSLILLSKNEPWGMVINEALLHNLPCLTTKEVQAAEMLKENGHKIVTEKFENIDKKFLLNYIKNSKKMNKELIDLYSPRDMAKDFFNLFKA